MSKKKNQIYYKTVKRVSSATFSIGAVDEKTANYEAMNMAYNIDWSGNDAEYYLAGQDAPQFIIGMDWELLKTQKKSLLEIIREYDEDFPAEAKPVKERLEHLQGILSLIDAIQDYAVDELDVPENTVFDLTEDDGETCTDGLHIPSFALPTDLKVGDAVKTTYICTHCGSDNVQVKAWVKPNENYKFVDEVNEGDKPGWCEDEQLHSIVETAQLRADAKVIGFQVVGEDGTENASDIHPDMDASFCLYNLSQANKMIEQNECNWRLLTVWEGDIEEPTMMFEGDPRA